MALFEIRLFPDPVLRKVCEPVDWKDSQLVKFVPKFLETLYAQPGGIGIAAPQVGLAKRLIIVDVSPRDPSNSCLVMINPRIKAPSGTVICREGCMSLPDYTGSVKRFAVVTVEWLDLKGVRHEKVLQGIEAICLQHEIDHLNGMLFIDRVGSLKTDVFPRAKRSPRRS